MASTKRKSSYTITHVIAVTALTGLFVALGAFFLIDLLVRVLPATKTEVRIVDRSSKKSAGYIGRISNQKSTHFVTIQHTNGMQRTFSCPKELYDRALLGLNHLQNAQLTINSFFSRPISLSISNSSDSLVKPGSILDKLINAAPPSSKKEITQYSLLLPLTGAVFGLIFCWLIAAYLVYKLPNKSDFNWYLFAIGILTSFVIGSRWN